MILRKRKSIRGIPMYEMFPAYLTDPNNWFIINDRLIIKGGNMTEPVITKKDTTYTIENGPVSINVILHHKDNHITIIPANGREGFVFIKSDPNMVWRIACLLQEAADIVSKEVE